VASKEMSNAAAAVALLPNQGA
jgi:hypothetical protein